MKLKTLTLLSSALLCTSTLLSCSTDDSPVPEKEIEKGQEGFQTEPEEATPYESIMLDAPQRKANEATTNFSYSLLRESFKQAQQRNCSPNVFISPLGVSNILTMLANGANEETLKEITDVLGADLNQLNSFYTLMADALPKADNQVTFSVANSVWINNGFHPSELYMDLLKSRFDAESFITNINTAEAKDAINQWCSDKTNAMIPEFLKRPLERCAMFLANAMYFDGKWTDPFDPENNTFEPFEGSNKEVEMMHGNVGIHYSGLSGGELVSILYGNGTYSLNIYLPSEGVSIDQALESSDSYLRPARSGSCILTMPKFSFSYEEDTMDDILKRLGINLLFNDGKSLSKIANNLYCSFIKQATALEVSEAGAKAAAVTGAGMLESCGEPSFEPAIPEVKVDRPFIFSITENSNGIVIFAGVMVTL